MIRWGSGKLKRCRCKDPWLTLSKRAVLVAHVFHRFNSNNNNDDDSNSNKRTWGSSSPQATPIHAASSRLPLPIFCRVAAQLRKRQQGDANEILLSLLAAIDESPPSFEFSGDAWMVRSEGRFSGFSLLDESFDHWQQSIILPA